MISLILATGITGFMALIQLRQFDSFATIIEMLRSSFSDMIPFLSLLYLMITIFSLIQYTIRYKEYTKHDTANLFVFGNSYLTLFGENPDSLHITDLQWIVYFCYSTLLSIVALNLLISLISNTFDKVLMSLDSFLCKTKAEMLIELSSFYPKYDEKDMKYLFIVNYSNEIIGEDKPTDEYQGRIRTLTKSLDGLNDKVNNIDAKMSMM